MMKLSRIGLGVAFALALGLVQMALPAKSAAQISLSISIAPPPLPVYDQPPCPGAGYLWVPGYWEYDYDDADYYWVPGYWVVAPSPGLLWTPGYWGWDGGYYVWHAGYWGPHVGFYGGVVYGFGYTGVGFAGGYWQNNVFFYNRSVTNVNTTVITNVYNKTVIVNNTNIKNVSFNGGSGGIQAKPTQTDLLAAKDQHIAPTQDQLNHVKLASQNKDLRASVN